MGTRTPQNEVDGPNRRQGNGVQVQPREENDKGPARTSKKENGALKPAQDAALKDYVCTIIPWARRLINHILIFTAIGRLLREGGIWFCL